MTAHDPADGPQSGSQPGPQSGARGEPRRERKAGTGPDARAESGPQTAPGEGARARHSAEPASERLVLVQRSARTDREATVYVKGFLGRNEQPEHFDAWIASHRRLQERLGWGPRAYGYCWQAGRIQGLPPVHHLSTARTAWQVLRALRGVGRMNLASAAGMALAEQAAIVVTRFVGQYRAASRASHERAEAFAERLVKLHRQYDHVRVVAHSLGARHAIEACALLAPEERPSELHLCAPAVHELRVDDKLAHAAREATVIYWSRGDAVLAAGFALLTLGQPLGSAGLRGHYAGVHAIDVGEHFRVRVHNRYQQRFHRFAVDAKVARELAAAAAAAARAGGEAGVAASGGDADAGSFEELEAAEEGIA